MLLVMLANIMAIITTIIVIITIAMKSIPTYQTVGNGMRMTVGIIMMELELSVNPTLTVC